MRILAMGMAAWVLAACGGDPAGTCNASNCEGCCTTAGVCKSGYDDGECGSAGFLCVSCTEDGNVCSSASTCVAGGTGGGTGTGGGNSSAGGGNGTAGGSAGGSAGGTAGGSAGGSAGGTTTCTPETDQAFCTRASRSRGTHTAFDNCGTSRTVNCGSCNGNQTCSATGTCCNVETDAAFCARKGLNCGSATGTDACGLPRTAVCGACTGQQTCAGGGTPNVCGQNICGGCTTPPTGVCTAPSITTGYYKGKTYNSPGTCVDPSTGQCTYSSTTTQCTEDCRNGACVQTSCTLGGGQCTSPSTGCKLTSTGTLRCLVTDTGGSQGVPCNEDIPGYRCDSRLRCVLPSFASTSICAYICASSSDCATVGLQNAHVCVKGPSETYGYCR